jgi:hypothetical protein
MRYELTRIAAGEPMLEQKVDFLGQRWAYCHVSTLVHLNNSSSASITFQTG